MEGPNSAPSPAANKSTYEAVALDDQEMEEKTSKVEPGKEGFVPVTPRSDHLPRSLNGRRYFQVQHLVSQPLKIQMMRTESSITLVCSWWTRQSCPLLFAAISWNMFMIVWNGIIIWMGSIIWTEDLFFYLTALFMMLIGWALAYKIICDYCNSTTIVVTQQAVSVEHGPLPTGTKPLMIYLSTVRFLCCCEVRESDAVVFSVVAVLYDRTKVDLLTSLDDVDEAHFVEQEMEGFLGLREIPPLEEFEIYTMVV